MSKRWPGGIVTKNQAIPTGPYQNSVASGIWTLLQQAYWAKQDLWPTAGRVAPGQQAYTTPGTFSWVAPAGITSISVVAIGGARSAGSSGGALSYKNNITVTPGTSYTVVVASSGQSYFINTSTVSAGTGSTRVGDGGGDGGGIYGGGAGGYSGNGGSPNIGGGAGSAGSGGGGGGSGVYSSGDDFASGGGGGVSILGQGTSGAGGGVSGTTGFGGGGGSGGGSGTTGTLTVKGDGGLYGGAPGLASNSGWGLGGTGAVRIIWPGNTRSFPSTNTGNL